MVYLRAIGGPVRTAAGLPNNLFPLIKTRQLGARLPIVKTEVVREAATIVMLGNSRGGGHAHLSWMACGVFHRIRSLGLELLRDTEGAPRMAGVADDLGSVVPDSSAVGRAGAGAVDRLGDACGRRNPGIGPRAAAR